MSMSDVLELASLLLVNTLAVELALLVLARIFKK